MASSWKAQMLRALLACGLLIALGSTSARATELPTQTIVSDAPGRDVGERAHDGVASPSVPLAAEPKAEVAVKNWLHTAMNLGAIAFLFWMVALMWRPGLGPSLMKPSDEP